jgi:hypothetical protein
MSAVGYQAGSVFHSCSLAFPITSFRFNQGFEVLHEFGSIILVTVPVNDVLDSLPGSLEVFTVK